MNDQWPQQISFNANHIEATASYVRDTQMNKTLPLLLRKCISMDFQKKKKRFYHLHKLLLTTTYFHACEGLILVLSGFCVEPKVPSLAPNMHSKIWEWMQKRKKIWEGLFKSNESCLFFEKVFCRWWLLITVGGPL